MAMKLTLAFLLCGLAQQAFGPAPDCIAFKTNGRLRGGEPFVATLPSGFEFRLVPEDGGWYIKVVSPSDPDADYMWVVTPPYRTAPQRQIGAGYGLNARESASFIRELYFVLSDEDYKTMFDLLAARRGNTEAIINARRRLSKGTVVLKITNFEISEDVFEWVTFEGRACVPK